MRRVMLISAVIVCLSAVLCAQVSKSNDTSVARNLSGTVLDKTNQVVPGAIVYLKNTRSFAVVTFITGQDGSYRFNNLSPNVDYEVRAESNGRRSQTKTLSSFDSHKQAHINLKLEK
ncbi:MAG: carboxypeptidase regulatory-like domain-containing protein [Acidobacteria bacterium]|nr:MAG: carboxypeptidase regulatory-like domain-containing protein [Acidobacteriota bacterium]